LIEATPQDDAGAEAQARFEYQVDLATCSCLQMLAGESIDEVICEWHEDYVVTWSGHPRELTSVKHLERDRPRWTMRGLISDGGVKHLYDRWVKRAGGARFVFRPTAVFGSTPATGPTPPPPPPPPAPRHSGERGRRGSFPK
jgi:hypothetical protein